jgi:hypothetical protein
MGEAAIRGGVRGLLDRESTPSREPDPPPLEVKAIEHPARACVLGKPAVDEVDTEILAERVRDRAGRTMGTGVPGRRCWHQIGLQPTRLLDQ